MPEPGYYLPQYNWSVAHFPGTPNLSLCARRPCDELATDSQVIAAIEEWGESNRRKYAASMKVK